MSFSQRYGYTPVRTALQVESMDDTLRTRLWNIVFAHFFADVRMDHSTKSDSEGVTVGRGIWCGYLNRRITDLPWHAGDLLEAICKDFFAAQWWGVYNFLEWVPMRQEQRKANRFRALCNFILKEELSGWRFVGDKLAPITNESEIQAIEQAEALSGTLKPVSLHIQYALQNLSDRQNPDYRTSIKESISAVEAMGRTLVPTAQTVAQALNGLDNTNVELHEKMKDGFKHLYWWTCDQAGIRHAMMDQSTVDFEDALFMLVSCSAFVNYLVAKAQKAGITF